MMEAIFIVWNAFRLNCLSLCSIIICLSSKNCFSLGSRCRLQHGYCLCLTILRKHWRWIIMVKTRSFKRRTYYKQHRHAVRQQNDALWEAVRAHWLPLIAPPVVYTENDLPPYLGHVTTIWRSLPRGHSHYPRVWLCSAVLTTVYEVNEIGGRSYWPSVLYWPILLTLPVLVTADLIDPDI